jgi:hypothetical protein
MTTDNLRKRHLNKPEDCIFRSDKESIHHVLFQYIVASQVWQTISQHFNIDVVGDYIFVAKFWIANKNMQLLMLFVLQFYGVFGKCEMT